MGRCIAQTSCSTDGPFGPAAGDTRTLPVPPRTSERRCPLRVVISTGRRNTLAKSLCWRLEVQRFPRPLVELACHLVQLGLGVRREIKALGEVLAQQAIGVFA